jgi:hypothetical protein
MPKVPWNSIAMEQSTPDLALTGIIAHGDLRDIDAGLLHGDSTIRPDWGGRVAAARREALA